jgi:8-oxoguanine deaminase
MATLLIHNARTIATSTNALGELPNASLLVRDNRIEYIGPAADVPAHLRDGADEVIAA